MLLALLSLFAMPRHDILDSFNDRRDYDRISMTLMLCRYDACAAYASARRHGDDISDICQAR